MKNSIILGAIMISSLSFGQKKNETNAALEFTRSYKPAMQTKDYATAKTAIVKAKEYIEMAAAHEDTKESAKTLYYKGLIYLEASKLATTTGDQEFLKAFGSNDETLNTSIASLSKSYGLGKKYKSDVKDAAINARNSFDIIANTAYEAEDFKSAATNYNWRAKYTSIIDLVDTAAIFYSAVCSEKAGDYDLASGKYLKVAELGYKGATSYNLASGAFRKAGNTEKAKEIVNKAREQFPNDKNLLLELVNINIDENNPAGAEAALTSAIEADPNNKQLYYTIGTIYIDLKENAKAEDALNKALAIDPAYTDAQYQLGAHLVSWGGDLKTEASNLKFGDARYDVMLAQSQEVYGRAVAPLETYISNNPSDGPVLNILYQLHRALGNTEKAMEFKKRAEEAK